MESPDKFPQLTIRVSGEEPLLQKPFVAELFRECKARGIHTALKSYS